MRKPYPPRRYWGCCVKRCKHVQTITVRIETDEKPMILPFCHQHMPVCVDFLKKIGASKDVKSPPPRCGYYRR